MKRAMGGAGGFAAQSPTVLVARALRQAAVSMSSKQPESVVQPLGCQSSSAWLLTRRHCLCMNECQCCLTSALLCMCGRGVELSDPQAASAARRSVVAPHRVREACGPHARSSCVGFNNGWRRQCRCKGHRPGCRQVCACTAGGSTIAQMWSLPAYCSVPIRSCACSACASVPRRRLPRMLFMSSLADFTVPWCARHPVSTQTCPTCWKCMSICYGGARRYESAQFFWLLHDCGVHAKHLCYQRTTHGEFVTAWRPRRKVRRALRSKSGCTCAFSVPNPTF